MRRLSAASLIASLALATAPSAHAQEEPSGDEAPLEKPASDSPEAARPPAFEGEKLRAQAFLIPMDEQARAPTTRVAQAIEKVLLHTQRYEVVDLGKAMSVEAPAAEASRADAGRKLVQDAKASAAEKSFPEAAAKLHEAVHSFEEALPAVTAHEYADAVLRLGIAEYMSGEEQPARDAFALYVRLDPQQKIDVTAIEPGVVAEVSEARATAAQAKRGTLEIEARPAGARVQVDGESRGPAPARLELSPGRHLVRVERAGFYPWAQVVEIAPRKAVKESMTLAATPTAASLNQIIAGAAEEVTRGTAGKNVLALAQRFSLDRLVIGSVRSQGEGHASVLIALVDARGMKLVGHKSMQAVADGTDADQLEFDAEQAAHTIVSGDASEGDTPEPSAPAPAAQRRVLAPSGDTAQAADDPDLVHARARRPAAEEGRKPAAPSDDARVAVPASASEPQAADAAPAPAPQPAARKKRARGLRNKTGTEDWDNDDSSPSSDK